MNEIALIGAGSSYTPELIQGLIARQGALGLSEVIVMDTDLARLGVLSESAKRMTRKAGVTFNIAATTTHRARRRAEIVGGD